MKLLLITLTMISSSLQANASTIVDQSCNAYVENFKELAAINLDRYSDVSINPQEVSQENTQWGALPFQTGNIVLENQGYKLHGQGKLKDKHFLVKWNTYNRFFGLFGQGFEISIYQVKDGQKFLVATHQDSNNPDGIRNAIESLPTCVTKEEVSQREKFFDENAKSLSAEKLFILGDES